jgi:hypothetical protein
MLNPQLLCGWKNGGPGGSRTRDLFNAIEARSQLRHRPTRIGWLNYTQHCRGGVKRRRSAKGEQR